MKQSDKRLNNVSFSKKNRFFHKQKAVKTLLLALFFSLMFTQCYYWSVPRGLKDLRLRIAQTERKELQGTARYHLTLAKELLQAAERQYDEADFTASSRFIKQAAKQLNRANEVYRQSPGPNNDPQAGGMN